MQISSYPRLEDALTSGGPRKFTPDPIGLILNFVFWPYVVALILLPDNAVAGRSVPVETALLFLASPFIFLHYTRNGRLRLDHRNRAFLWLALILVSLIVVTAFKENWLASVRAASWGLSALLCGSVVTSGRQMLRLCYVMLALSWIASAVAIFRYGLLVPEWPVIFNFLSRNTFSYFLVIGVACSLAIFATGRWRLLCALSAILFITQIFLSGSRGASIAIIIGIAFLMWKFASAKQIGSVRTPILVAGFLAIAAIAIVVGVNEELQSRLASIFSTADRGNSNYYRYSLYAATFKALPQIFAFGAAPGQENYILFTHTVDQYNHLLRGPISTDSDYITLTLLAGVFPAICLLGFVISIALISSRILISHETRSQTVMTAFLVSLMLVQTSLNDIMTSQFGWFLAGWTLAVLKLTSRPRLPAGSGRQKMPWELRDLHA